MATNQEIAALAVSLTLDNDNFTKSMSAIEKSVKNLDKDFKSAGMGVENFENTFTGLNQKIELTQKKIELYNTKLAKQREAQEKLRSTIDGQIAKMNELETSLGRGSAEWKKQSELVARNSEKFEKLGTDINQTEGKIRGFASEMSRIDTVLQSAGTEATQLGNKLQDMADKAKKAGDNVKDVGDGLKGMGDAAAPAGLAVAGIGVAAVAAMASSDTALTKIKVGLGQTGKEADATAERVQELARRGFNFEGANDAVIQITKTLGDLLNPKQIDDMAAELATLQEVLGVDIEESTKAANSAMRNFGISGQEATDLIAAGLQSPLNASGEFLDSLYEYSPQFAKLGFSAEESMAIMNAGMKDGAFSIDKAADSVKEFSLRVGEVNKNSEAALEGLGINVGEATKAINEGGEAGKNMSIKIATALAGVEDKTKQNAMAVALFGTQYEDVGDAAFTALSGIAENTIETKGAADKARIAFEESFGAKMQATLTRLQEPLIQIGTALLPVIDIVADLITKFAEWFATLSPGTITAITAVGGFVLALAPLLIIAGQIATGIGSMILVFGKIGLVLSKLGPLFTGIATAAKVVGAAIAGVSIPVLATIAAIGLLIGAGVLIYRNWDVIKEKAAQLGAFLAKVWEGIKIIVSAGWEIVKAKTVSVWNGITDFFKKWGTTMLVVISGPLGWIAALIYKNWDAIKAATLKAFNAIKTTISNVWNGIKTVISTVLNFLKNAIVNAFNFYKTTISNVLNAIKSGMSAAWNAIKTTISNVLNAIKSTISSVWNSIKSIVISAVNGVKSAATNGFNAVKSSITSVMNGIKSVISSVWNAIKSVISSAVSGIKSAVSSGFSGLKSIMTAPFEAAKAVIDGILGKIGSAVSGVKKIAGKLFATEGPTFVANPTAPVEGTMGISAQGTATNSMTGYSSGGGGIMQSIMDLKTSMSAIDFSGEKFTGDNKITATASSTKADSMVMAKGMALQNKNLETQNNLLMQMVTMMAKGHEIHVDVDGETIVKAIKTPMDIALRKNRDSQSRARGGK